MTDLTPVDAALIVFGVAIVFAAFALLVKMLRLPTSTYSILLRADCIFEGVAAIGMILSLYGLKEYGEAAEILPSVLLMIVIILFTLVELEFLKLMAPFVAWVSPVVVFRTQIATVVIATAIAFFSAQRFLPDPIRKAADTLWLLAATTVGFYEILQQGYFVYFILRKMPRTTPAFRTKYVSIVILASMVFFFALFLSLATPPEMRSRNTLFVNLLVLVHHLISMLPMLGMRSEMASAKSGGGAGTKRTLIKKSSRILSWLGRSKRDGQDKSMQSAPTEGIRAPMAPFNTVMPRSASLIPQVSEFEPGPSDMINSGPVDIREIDSNLVNSHPSETTE